MTEPTTQCVSCGASITSGDFCWLCGGKIISTTQLAGQASNANPYAAPETAASTTSTMAVSVPLIATVIVVSAGLAMAAPGFGIPIAVVVTPALVRTIVEASRKRADGTDLSTPLKAKLFFVSLAGTVAACVTAGVTFFATCAAGCFGLLALDATSFNMGDAAFMVVFIASGIIGLVCGGLALRASWRKRTR